MDRWIFMVWKVGEKRENGFQSSWLKSALLYGDIMGLGGGFKYFFFSPPFGDDSHFD